MFYSCLYFCTVREDSAEVFLYSGTRNSFRPICHNFVRFVTQSKNFLHKIWSPANHYLSLQCVRVTSNAEERLASVAQRVRQYF